MDTKKNLLNVRQSFHHELIPIHSSVKWDLETISQLTY